MKTIILVDGELAYDYLPMASELPPVLFLHGALGVRGQFDAMAGHFSDRSRLALDFPSHGASRTTRESLDTEYLVRQVLALLDELQIDRVDIIGHSMGGYVGLVLAHLAPERVRSVVTLGTKFYWTAQAIRVADQGLDPALLTARSQRFYDALERTHSASGAERTLQLTQTLIRDFARWQLDEPMLRKAAVPLLICAGDRDELVPAAEVLQLFAAIGSTSNAMAILPATGHPVQQLPLPCFQALVERFWQSL